MDDTEGAISPLDAFGAKSGLERIALPPFTALIK
jgi:hypothetical protein